MSGFLESLKSQYAHDAIVLAGIENGSVRGIPLTQGKIAIVDVEDYERLSQWKWCARKDHYTFYASRTIYPDGRAGKHVTIQMHRVVLMVDIGDESLDHKNRNGIDNRKNNLRKAIGSLNQINCKKRKDNSSGYRGVSWSRVWLKWSARISVNGKRIFCGWHSSAGNAARAYNIAAIKYYGETAILNQEETT